MRMVRTGWNRRKNFMHTSDLSTVLLSYIKREQNNIHLFIYLFSGSSGVNLIIYSNWEAGYGYTPLFRVHKTTEPIIMKLKS